MRKKSVSKRRSVVSQLLSFGILLIVLSVAGVLHGHNMFKFPFFENDEGTYFAQAWSVLSEGKLAPYTYWYDHAPVGWLFTAVWIFLTGGLFTFGFALNSARVFMLLIHLANTALLYCMTQRISRSRVGALVASVFFIASPLAVYFHRRMLLDNLMVFWLLISISLLVFGKHKLRYVILSAVAFGISVLTKENAIFFAPVLAWLATVRSHRSHQLIAAVKWAAVAGAIISMYPLFALLKGELFPQGSILSPPYPHVSLLETLRMHAGRGSGLPFWQQMSDFQVNVRYWFKIDRLLITVGFVSVFCNLLFAPLSRKSRLAFLMANTQLLFIARGKKVINFYLISFLPIFSFYIGVLAGHVSRLLGKIRPGYSVAFGVVLIATLTYHYAPLAVPYLTKDETTAQLQAVEWIKRSVEPDAAIAIDFYSYLDLTNERFPGDPVFPNADWFWKVELDPDVYEDKLHNDFRNVDYVMMTAESQRQIGYFPRETSLLRQSLDRSVKQAEFSLDESFSEHFSLQEQTMPNGDWVVLYKQQRIDLAKSWQSYKQTFMNTAGYVQAPEQRGYVISEAQSYALLRAVWMDDQETFEQVWSWTAERMRLRNSALFGWKVFVPSMRLADQGNAPDADQDIALALLLAHKRWGEERYREEAIPIIAEIWQKNVFVDQELAMVTAGNWAVSSEYVTLNPSYVAPYAYRMFAAVDPNPEHDWMAVVDGSYLLLQKCSQNLLDKNYSSRLPPEWCRYERDKRAFTASKAPQPESSEYGYNAFRLPWKVYLDYQWFNESRAVEYLRSLDYVVEQHNAGKLVDVYSHDAVPQTKATRYAHIMNFPIFLISDPTLAQKIMNDVILPTYTDAGERAYWYEGDEYYLQNWAWFAMGIYQGDLRKEW